LAPKHLNLKVTEVLTQEATANSMHNSEMRLRNVENPVPGS